MQRLFSAFPNGWPGCGLLLLRVSCGAPLLFIETARPWEWPVDSFFWMRLSGVLTAVLILAGWWTPLAASCQALFQVVLAFAADTFASTHLIFALIGVSLVMLGPGAWSIDARIYGRKRIDLGHPKH
jgi:putative oxidoreductase